MRSARPFSFLLVCLCVFQSVLLPMPASAQSAEAQPQAAPQQRFAPGQLLVKFKDGTSAVEQSSIRQRHNMEHMSDATVRRAQLMAVEEGKEVELAESLMQDPSVAYAEPDYLYYALDLPAAIDIVEPNDELYETQWGLTQIDAPTAWATTTGSDDIVIAVVDTGVELTHPDLATNLVPGATFLRRSTDADDDAGHGTHVASVAAGSANNSIGVSGVAWNTKVMPIKVLNRSGAGRISDIADGIEWAVDNGADIINLSLGGSESSNTLQEAVNYADSQGVLVVAAVGNEFESGSPTSYPAAFENVLAVGAINQDDQHASFSNRGNYVDVVAPGVDIVGAVPSTLGTSYASYSGTSMATPFASGLAALLLSVNPDLSNEQLRSIIRETAVDVESSGWDDLTGYGRIDAAAAVDAALLTTIGQTLNPALYLPLVAP